MTSESSPTPTPIDNLNEKPSKIENNSKESQGILSEDDNINDLAQVIELVNLISKIRKRSPKILQLLPKHKNAENNKGQAYLKTEAMIDKS
ncbi:hypothetical protein TNCV_1079211 [Trichonephila clavipes]|nr:hypothetical protein TNCV_1079211 [Trichonephila clavipes]